MNKNVEILFYNKLNNGSLLSNDMAIKLKTKEGDEIMVFTISEMEVFWNPFEVNSENAVFSRDSFFCFLFTSIFPNSNPSIIFALLLYF